MASPTHPGMPVLRRVQLVSVGLLLTFCIVVAIITFSPGPPDPTGQQALKSFLYHAHRHGLPWWISFNKIEFGANILMFVPIGMFGALALSRTRWLVVPGAALSSMIIEITQASGLPQRVGTPQDVIANSLGAVIGYLLACLVVWSIDRAARIRGAREWLAGITAQPPTGIRPAPTDS